MCSAADEKLAVHVVARVADISYEPAVASAILDCLGIPDEVLSCARARDPTDDDGLLPCADAN
jgi:hypothetical protein